MNTLIKISAIVIVFVLLSLLLKSNDFGFIFFLRIAVICIIFYLIFDVLSAFLTQIVDMFTVLEIDGYYIKTLIKVAGIAIVSDFISDTLKDNNENALSRIVEMSAKIFIIVSSLPMMNSLVAFCMEIIK